MGDEINDIRLLKKCGFAFAVGDAIQEVKDIVDVVLTKPGGHGAIRELTQMIVDAHQTTGADVYEKILEHKYFDENE